jgi:prolipoprotein diacylglyceryl transferase
LPLGQAIGRWGNWFNQELFGLTTDLPWGLSVDDAYLPAGAASGTLFHPTFLYESMWNLGLAGVLIVVGRHWGRNGGGLLAVYVAGYGLGRFWVEGLRIDRADELAGLRWNQWVAAAAVVGGVALAVRAHRRASGVVGEDVVPDSDAAPLGHHDDGLGTPPVA